MCQVQGAAWLCRTFRPFHLVSLHFWAECGPWVFQPEEERSHQLTPSRSHLISQYEITGMAVTYIRGKQGGWTEEINPDLQSTEERLKRWKATVQLWITRTKMQTQTRCMTSLRVPCIIYTQCTHSPARGFSSTTGLGPFAPTKHRLLIH